MVDRYKRDKIKVGIVSGDDEDRKYCGHCLEFGFRNKLGVLIVKEGEQRAPDWPNWLQCWTCGKVYPRHEVKQEQELTGFAEPSDDPFESNSSVVLGIPKRTTEEGKRLADKKRRNRTTIHHDKDVEREIQQHGSDSVRIIFDSNP